MKTIKEVGSDGPICSPCPGHKDLIVWQRSMALVAECYRLSGRFPPSERFGLVTQIRRAAMSVAANIAEGHGRVHRGAFLNHLSIARGSLKEVETYLEAGRMLHFASVEDLQTATHLADEISRMLTVLRRRLL